MVYGHENEHIGVEQVSFLLKTSLETMETMILIVLLSTVFTITETTEPMLSPNHRRNCLVGVQWTC